MRGKKATNPKVYLGCAKWRRTEWVGKIYPLKTKKGDFLDHYVKHYNSIELNATHFKVYGAAGVAKWVAKARKKDFMFCPKMFQGITHRGSLLNKEFITTEFLRGIIAFEKHLGPTFVQVSDTFTTKQKEELFIFLCSLPTNMQFFLELHIPDWFGKVDMKAELFDFLRSINMDIVITDTSARRDCAHLHAIVPKTFIRYVGYNLHPADYTRVDDWINRMKYWLDNGIEEIYFLMRMHDETFSSELTVHKEDKIAAACGLNLIKRKFIDPSQTDLFDGK